MKKIDKEIIIDYEQNKTDCFNKVYRAMNPAKKEKSISQEDAAKILCEHLGHMSFFENIHYKNIFVMIARQIEHYDAVHFMREIETLHPNPIKVK